MNGTFRFDSGKVSKLSLAFLEQASGTDSEQWPSITRDLFVHTQDFYVGTVFYALNEALDDAPKAAVYLTQHPILANWLENKIAESCASYITSYNPPIFMEECMKDVTGSSSDITYTDDEATAEIQYALFRVFDNVDYRHELYMPILHFVRCLCVETNSQFKVLDLAESLCSALGVDYYL